ncbi:MAG: hypothetical protein MRZ71_10470 [Bacteroidales bacterium]|nr:hypothetical protein [Bacteroidales bacterium]
MAVALTERLKAIIDSGLYKNVRTLALTAKINEVTLGEAFRGADSRFSTIEAVLKVCPAVRAEWFMRGEGEMLHPNSSEYKNYGTYSKAIAEKAAADNVVNESVKEKLEFFQRENQYLHDQIKIKDEQIASLLALLTNKPKEV